MAIHKPVLNPKQLDDLEKDLVSGRNSATCFPSLALLTIICVQDPRGCIDVVPFQDCIVLTVCLRLSVCEPQIQNCTESGH